MASEKGFFDVFKRYTPSSEKRELLLRAHSAKFRYSQSPIRVEVELSFDYHEDAELIYQIEDECRTLYEADSFKILPHFPPSEFTIERFGEITAEAAVCGAVTNGFFMNAEYEDDGVTITASLPFSDNGITFVRNADTEQILENILWNRYSVERSVKIVSGKNVEKYEEKREELRRRKIIEVEEQNRIDFMAKREENARLREEEARERDPHYDFDKKSGVSSATGNNIKISDTEFVMGASRYSTASPESVWGEEFDIDSPTPLSDIENAKANIIVLGKVFSVETKETRSGDKTTVTIGISDGASGVYAKKSLPNEEIGWVKGFKPGVSVAVLGRILRDKFDSEPFLSFRGIRKIKEIGRKDKAEKKRVELHLHSNMSQKDAIITPEEIVKTALSWGHKAIAVTDHGNVQAFPEVMLAYEKAEKSAKEKGEPFDFKILYGIEGYFVNDTAKCVFGTDYPAFDEEMVVFDLETTGLSSRANKIIEIGAVKIKAGEIIDVMDIFVDPEEPIPPEITELTLRRVN